jgi:hypothetical protein
MKKMLWAVMVGLTVVASGCVHTVNDSHTGAIWFGNDQFEGRYQRTVDQVYAAAYKVVTDNGALISEYIPHDSTNEVRSLEAKVNNCNVWVRVEAVSTSPVVTSVIVQARTHMGTRDELLAHELEKEIAISLVGMH